MHIELNGLLVTFDRAIKMLHDVGFTSFAYFKERMPIFQKI
jgi:hypothetical protein